MDEDENHGAMKKSRSSNEMNNCLLRFPKVGQDIFKQLDNKTLANCKMVSRTWNDFNNQNKLIWIRKIQKHHRNHIDFKEDWKSVMVKIPFEILVGKSIF